MDPTFLVFYFLALAFITAGALYWSRFHLLKFISVGMLFFIAGAIYFSFESYKGWPTDDIKDRIRVMSIDIHEPAQEDDGAIYVWGISLTQPENSIFRYVQEGAPRNYVLPFTEESASEFYEAQEKLKKGFVVIMDESKKVEGEDGEKTEKKGDSNADSPGTVKNYTPPVLEIITPHNMYPKSGND